MGHQFLKRLWRWRRRRWGWVGREWRCRRDRNLDRDFDRWLRDPFQDKVYMRSLLWSNLEELPPLLSPRSLSHPFHLSISNLLSLLHTHDDEFNQWMSHAKVSHCLLFLVPIGPLSGPKDRQHIDYCFLHSLFAFQNSQSQL